jgi:Cdc6-like AAA superfamily ATPase
MENSPNKDMIFTFIDAFKLAATTVISALPSDLSDEAAETTSRELADEINTNAEKLQLTVGIIYTNAMGDETWISTAVKLFVHLSLVLSQPIHDPEVPAGKNKTSLVGAMLMRRYIHTTLQGDFHSDMQTPEWSLPRLWLLIELANCASPVRLGLGSRVDVARRMVESEFLLQGSNLDSLLEYVYWVGAGVDEVPEREEELSEVLAELWDKVEDEPLLSRLMVAGLMWMRGNGWTMMVTQDDELDQD